MLNATKRIAIVGGGFSGIGCIAMLKEEGLEPVCFEKSDKYGGTWCYREESEEGVSSIMATTIINHSKEMGAISNFPPRKEYNNYMRHSEMYQYITEYAKNKDCERYIHFHTQVVHVKKAEDYEETGQWAVTVKDTLSGKESTDIYDGIMVCVGHINRPKIPTYPGQNAFRGKIMHTHSLKRATEFIGKNVVVVGIGCSALDAAVEISSVAKQVYLSTRSGAFIINRVGPNGYPIDYVLLRRYIAIFLEILPINVCSWFIETFYLDRHFDHRLYAIQPKYHLFSKEPILNDHIASKLLSGSVIQKPDIDHFTENGVVFKGETSVTEMDAVIMATGYTWKFPFLEEGVIMKDGDKINLYKCVFPPHLSHPTLAIISFVLPFGPGIPIGELQIRWAAHIFSGKGHLPSKETMMKDTEKRYQRNKKRFAPNEKNSIREDFVQYMDEIATELGVKPNFLKLFFTDIRLFLKLWFGPCVPYQYRLQGPHKWDGARKAIMTCGERLYWPLQKRESKKGIFQRIIEFIENIVPKNILFWK